MCVFMACRGLLKVQEGPNKEYDVSSKGTNGKIKLNITWESYVSSLPLIIVV